MKKLQLPLLLMLISMGMWGTARAQEEPAAEDPHQAFLQAVEEYKQSIRDIKSLQVEFQAGDESKQAQVNQKLKDVATIGRQRMQKMVVTAMAAFKADPKQNPQVGLLLKEVAGHHAFGAKPQGATGGNHIGGDQPERALEVVNTLVEGGESSADLYVIGALSAVFTNDFVTARKYYDLAIQEKAFDEVPLEIDENAPPAARYWFMAREHYRVLDQLEQEWEDEAKIRAAEAQADDLPRVKLETTKGEIVLELFENEAPQATANFLTLVKQGYYDGLPFHRVLPLFMAQGGDNGRGPGYTIRCECYQPNHRKHFRGTLSMAKTSARDSGNAQFFLCFIPTKPLDGGYTAFGRVVEGIEVLGDLQKIDPDPKVAGPRPEPDKMIKATVLRDRGHEYQFEKL